MSNDGLEPRPAAQSPQARLEAMQEFLSEELEPNTQRAYRTDLRSWQRYCQERGLPAWPVDMLGIVLYVEHLVDEGKALKTVQRRVGGLRSVAAKAGQPFAPEVLLASTRALAVARKRIMKEPGRRGRGKAKAVTVEELRAMSAACPDRLLGVRDRALLLLGFTCGARRSELAGLQVEDITEHEEGLDVHIRWSKTGQERWPTVPYGEHRLTCAVRSWRAWLTASGITEGAAFRHIDRGENLRGPLTPEGVGDAVAAAAERAGLGPRRAHGLRSGMATAARQAGHDAVAIAEQGGWARHSREMLGYMQIVNRWKESPVRGIGL